MTKLGILELVGVVPKNLTTNMTVLDVLFRNQFAKLMAILEVNILFPVPVWPYIKNGRRKLPKM